MRAQAPRALNALRSPSPRWIDSARGRALVLTAGAGPDHSIRRRLLALTQAQLQREIAQRADLAAADVKRMFEALEEVVLDEIGNAQKVKIGNLVQLTVALKAATKARPGRNPATGEEITIAAKPASVALRARPLARAKAALPTVQKARQSLAR